MGDSDSRQIVRDSLFIMAELRLDGRDGDHRVKVRNLSVGGLMAEGDLRVSRGAVVWINLRNAGWVEGSVAWVQDKRFGVAFREDVDARAVRGPAAAPQLPEAMILNRRFAAPPAPKGSSRKVI